MVRRGWNVVAASRHPEALKELAAAPNVLSVSLDVTDPASVARAVSVALERFGGIDVLVNNAGYGLFGPLEGASPEEVERQFRTNVFGAILLIQHVMPGMRRRRGGTIINVSSVGGRIAAPFASLYHASKFAIEGLSESLRHEASLHGIRVKLVEPAHFKTGFITRSLRVAHHADYEAALGNYMEWVYRSDRTAPGPERVAETILRAAQDTSSRLRYPVKGTLILAMNRWLPDAFWRTLLGAGMTRRPKAEAGTRDRQE
jgi:NAD(P)-dependent dehydrogenase (short-subunit alcohol dehydrogenase family)